MFSRCLLNKWQRQWITLKTTYCMINSPNTYQQKTASLLLPTRDEHIDYHVSILWNLPLNILESILFEKLWYHCANTKRTFESFRHYICGNLCVKTIQGIFYMVFHVTWLSDMYGSDVRVEKLTAQPLSGKWATQRDHGRMDGKRKEEV